MITAQHRNILRDPTSPMLPLPIDGALVQFRRLLSQRVEAEGRDLLTPAH
jgi:vanillate O-demethylase monooxygenase subunit